jgi:hypothetical protein
MQQSFSLTGSIKRYRLLIQSYTFEGTKQVMETALVKPVVDALICIFEKARGIKLKSSAEKSLAEAIRELLNASPNENIATAKIAVAKAAGIISSDLLIAEEMLTKVKKSKKLAAKDTAAKKPARKKVVAKKRTSEKNQPSKQK